MDRLESKFDSLLKQVNAWNTSSPVRKPKSGNKRKVKSSSGPGVTANHNWRSQNTSPSTYEPAQHKTIKKSSSVRVGAICCDGTRSYAIGRGACSHHGGVCQWLYE